MIVGSIVWIKPSPRDKRLAEWRRDAIMAGLKVQMKGVTAEPKKSGVREDIPGLSYMLYQSSPIKGDDKKWFVVKTDAWLTDGLPSEWSWYEEEKQEYVDDICDHIKNAPLPIIAIERTPNFSRIVWNETGDQFDPNALKAFLKAVQATF